MLVFKGVIRATQEIVNGENGRAGVEQEKVRLSGLREKKDILVLGAPHGIVPLGPMP